MSITPSPTHRGWHYDAQNSRLSARFNGTEVFDFDANDFAIAVAATFSSTVALNGGVSGSISTSGAGDAFIASQGNVKLGNPGAFATTEPQGAVVMGGTSLAGIAPVGAIATAAAVFASDTVVRKIIADGTASNVET